MIITNLNLPRYYVIVVQVHGFSFKLYNFDLTVFCDNGTVFCAVLWVFSCNVWKRGRRFLSLFKRKNIPISSIFCVTIKPWTGNKLRLKRLFLHEFLYCGNWAVCDPLMSFTKIFRYLCQSLCKREF